MREKLRSHSLFELTQLAAEGLGDVEPVGWGCATACRNVDDSESELGRFFHASVCKLQYFEVAQVYDSCKYLHVEPHWADSEDRKSVV